VIPDRVDIAGTLRTTDEANRGALKMEIDRICSACELSTGVHIQRRFHNSLGSVVNDPRCAAALERAAETVLGPEHIDHIHLPSMGAEDFAFYLEHAPGAMLRLGTGRAGSENPFLHSPHFDIDERALLTGTRILMRAALDIGRSIAREEW
jgi:amidohydrolase